MDGKTAKAAEHALKRRNATEAKHAAAKPVAKAKTKKETSNG